MDMVEQDQQKLLRQLPGVDEMLKWSEVEMLAATSPRSLLVAAVRRAVQGVRREILTGQIETVTEKIAPEYLVAAIKAELLDMTRPQLRPVINATGVVLHTNLGRAVLAEAVQEHLSRLNQGYCNLELDLATGKRGSRYSHVEDLLLHFTGAQSALVVNNNAAAVLLALNTLARGKEVLVSRGQLVEIGGSFRVPEVMEWSGCRLVEVGTTNKTHLSDYAKAIGPETALLLKVHTSNYRILGFTAEVEANELVQLAQQNHLPVLEDLGSGMLVDLSNYGLPAEPTVQESVAAGIDVITFSGDKLLGGPQAGIIVGKQEYIERMKRNPLTRALRIDKLTLAALEATLRIYQDPAEASRKVPVLRMLTLNREELKVRAEQLAAKITAAVGKSLQVTIEPDQSQVGGGAMPLAELPTWVVVLETSLLTAQQLEERLRKAERPILARVAKGRVLLDARTLQPGETEEICRVLAKIFSNS
jgi:L-seryl-tRNA(Ser) seleniumtransferase